jgi:hypothetical protein
MSKIEESGWYRSSASKELRRTYCPHCPMSLRCVVDGGERLGVSISYRTTLLDHLQIRCETMLDDKIDRVVFYVSKKDVRFET